MKILIRVHSGEHCEIYAALVYFDPLWALRVLDNWPSVEGQEPTEICFADGCDWIRDGNMDVVDLLEGGPVRLPDDADIDDLEVGGLEVAGELARVNGEELVFGHNYCHWRGHEKYSDQICETDMLTSMDIKRLVTGADALREVVNESGNCQDQ